MVAYRRAIAKPDDPHIHISLSDRLPAHLRRLLVSGPEVRHVRNGVPGSGHRLLRCGHERSTLGQPPQLRRVAHKHPTRRFRHDRQHPTHRYAPTRPRPAGPRTSVPETRHPRTPVRRWGWASTTGHLIADRNLPLHAHDPVGLAGSYLFGSCSGVEDSLAIQPSFWMEMIRSHRTTSWSRSAGDVVAAASRRSRLSSSAVRRYSINWYS